MLGCGLTHSEAMAALPDDTHRWAYVTLHLSPLGNYHGLFRYAPEYLALDLRCDAARASRILEKLAGVGLIEWHAKAKVLRIARWHLKENGPSNQTVAMRRLREAAALKAPPEMLRANFAELTLAIARSLGGTATSRFDPTKEVTIQVRAELEAAIRKHARTFPDFRDDLARAGADETDVELWQIIALTLPEVAPSDTVSTPYRHGGHIEKEKEREKGKGKGIERGRVREGERKGKGAASAAPLANGDGRAVFQRIAAEPAALASLSKAEVAALQAQVADCVVRGTLGPIREWVDAALLDRLHRNAYISGTDRKLLAQIVRKDHGEADAKT